MIGNGLDTVRGLLRQLRYWMSVRDCYGSIHLIVSVAFGLGITPFLVRRKSLGESSLEQSWYGFLNAISRWLLLAYCYVHINMNGESMIGYFMSNHVSQVSTRLHDILGIIVAICIFIVPLLLRRHFLRSVRTVVEVDQRLKRLRCPVNFNTVLVLVLLIMALIVLGNVILITTCLVCLSKMDVHASWQLTVIMVYELLVTSITICMFCLMTKSVQRRLACLHKVSDVCNYLL